MSPAVPAATTTPEHDVQWLTPVFLVSGVAALTYQVAWERVLYTIFGINSEAVTVVVTAFLLGLGLGSVAGGWVSKRPGCRHLRWFAAAEFSIAAFGAVSVPFYHSVGSATLGMSALGTAAVTFALVLIPTMLMGATLPLLVTYAVARSGSVGWSVGTLYFVNTAGSAAAALLTVVLLLPRLGLQGSVLAAAACNVAVAAVALARDARESRAADAAPLATLGRPA
jgi:predicted membrane-bound spermidine synthase